VIQPRSLSLALLTTLAVALLLALATIGVNRAIEHLGGAWDYAPEDAEWHLSPTAQALIDEAYRGLDGETVLDNHVHVLSNGQLSGDGFDNRSYIHDRFLSWWQPRDRVRGAILMSAAGIEAPAELDRAYLSRLVRLARSLPGEHRLRLLALDQQYSAAGDPRPGETAVHVDNDYVVYLAERYPELFEPVVSVHPYRPNAVADLKRWAERGIEAVKWLPALQGIDPADERLGAYYDALADNDLTLITHTGHRTRLAAGNPEWGNPLRYRPALDRGVRIVMTHCAGSGHYSDPGSGQSVPAYELFLRLLDDPAYEGRLYGDIAGLAHRERASETLSAILRRPDTHDRLVYGSDYPSPAVNRSVDVERLSAQGFVTTPQAKALREIYEVNPLLFDFVLKRVMRLPHTELGLPASVFTRRPGD